MKNSLFLVVILPFFAFGQNLIQRNDSLIIKNDGKERFVATLKAEEVHLNSNFILFLKDKKWGALDTQGNKIIEPKYNYLFYLDRNDCFMASYGEGKIGIIDRNENVLLPFEYNQIPIDAGLFELGDYQPVSKKGKFGLIDRNFKLVCPTEYDYYFGLIANNLIPVFTKSKGYALYDLNLQKISSGYFEDIYPLEETDFAIYKKKNKYGLYCISKKKIITKAKYDKIIDINSGDGIVCYEKNGISGTMKLDGTIIDKK